MFNANKKLSLEESRKFPVIILVIGLLDFLLQSVFRYYHLGVSNSGISFGWLSTEDWRLRFFWMFVAIVLYGILRHVKNSPSVMMIMTGGLINSVQRVVYGGVWDYIQLPFVPFMNNISDIMISVGVVLFLIRNK